MAVTPLRQDDSEENTHLVLVDLTNTITGNTKQVVTVDDYQSVTQEVVMFATVEGISAGAIDIEISNAP